MEGSSLVQHVVTLIKKLDVLTFLIVKIFFDMFVLTATQLHNSQVAQTKKIQICPLFVKFITGLY